MNKNCALLAAALLVGCEAKELHWDATGTFEATEITVSAEQNGKLVDFLCIEGSVVDSLAPIGVIDTVPLSLRVAQLKASRSSAAAQVADVAVQMAATRQQIEWQRSEWSRFKTLAAKNAATQKQVDDIANQIQVLERQLTAQQSSLERGNRSIDDQAQALELQVKEAEDQLKKCIVRSPIKGTLLVRLAEQGEFATVGRPLFTVADMEAIYLRAYITADQLTQMKLNQKVDVYADWGAQEQRQYEGVVEWISDRAEFTPKTIQTRNERANLVYAVKIRVQNDGYLKIGMYGQVNIKQK